jgi:two-component system CheB/CheR fusion protein
MSDARTHEEPTAPPDDSTVRVVAIGASAGGLEALQLFLRAVPADTGLAFVIVQHLAPTGGGMLVELLQRETDLPVAQVTDGMELAGDHVYVIPPASDMSIANDRLRLLEPHAPRGLRLPVDYFFRALAVDRRADSIGVVLSGTGSDGTLGLRDIKECAGTVFVQDPATAKFDGMPRSAISAQLADVVAPAEELPARILDFLRHTRAAAAPGSASIDADLDGLEKVMIVLRERTGQDFLAYKPSTKGRRIARRMALHQLAHIEDYVRLLQDDPVEVDLLAKELLIGVTSFFRDPNVWSWLAEHTIPELLDQHPGETLRAWVAGCSTGEEAYSLAIAFRETVDAARMPHPCSLKVFATDLDRDAIERARIGRYPANIAADVSEERLERWFVEVEDGFQIRPEIREMIVFAQQNLVMDPPFTRLDLMSCRNLLIYFNPELQQRVIRLAHYSLAPGGTLVLGSSETIGTSTDLFETLAPKERVYRRRETADTGPFVEFPFRSTSGRSLPAPRAAAAAAAPALQSAVNELLLREHTPPAVLTTPDGEILYVSGRIGRYLEPAAGTATTNALKMARAELGDQLRDAFDEARRTGATATTRAERVSIDGAERAVDITARLLDAPDQLAGTVMVVFDDVVPDQDGRTAAPDPDERVVVLTNELRRAREHLQALNEEMQTSQEELRSVNEEMQSTNEELQSTNEELSTSQEELQSMNEELQTVNSELRAKVDELSLVGDDLRNLLDSTDIAVLFLDAQRGVRRFTPRMSEIIKLQQNDVGRPITDLATDLDYPDFAADVDAVLASEQPRERDAPASGGRWYRVRVMPYRTQRQVVDGTVITFLDISSSKQLEQRLRDAADQPDAEGDEA